MDEINGTIASNVAIEGRMDVASFTSGGGGGTSNYNQLLNKPQINGVELTGNKSTTDLQISYNALQDRPFIPNSYADLSDHPKINNVELTGNKTSAQLNINYNDLIGKPSIPTTTQIVDLIYPVGSIYISVNAANPGTIMGGTWVSFGTGKTLVGVDSADTDFNAPEKVGGEKAHTLTIAEMPSHRHDTLPSYGSNNLTTNTNNHGKMMGAASSAGWATNAVNDDANNHPIKLTGGDGAHNNMPPYVTTYMWKRTA